METIFGVKFVNDLLLIMEYSSRETEDLSRPSIGKVKPQTSEMGIQTPVHFTEKNKDYSHNWNEWELRKQAVKIVRGLSSMFNIS